MNMCKYAKIWSMAAFLCLASGILVHAQDAAMAPNAGAGEIAADEDTVSLSVSNAPIQEVLRSLAAMRDNINIVVDPDVGGTVTLELDKVPLDVALELITETNGLVVSKKGENIYQVHRPRVAREEAIVVELYTSEAIAALSDAVVMALVPGPELSPEQARQVLQQQPGMYIRRLTVANQPAIEVINAIARQADLSFAFSADLSARGESAAPAAAQPAGRAPAAAAPAARTLPSISVNLRNLSVENGIKLVAAQGGLSAVQENGVWVVSRMTAQQMQLDPLKLETFHVNFIPLDDDLVQLFQRLATDRGIVQRGKNKVLIVKDTAEGIDTVRQALAIMDKPTPQVLIEARFFQVSSGLTKKIGIDWQDLGSASGASFDLKTPDDFTFQYYSDLEKQTDALTAVLEIPDFNFVLHALRNNADARELANPKLIVNSDEQASIHIGEQRPILRIQQETTDTGVLTTAELDPDYGGETIEEISLSDTAAGAATRGRRYTTNKGYLDLGTKLTVLPSVKTEDEVYIRVVPELMSDLNRPVQVRVGRDAVQEFPVLFRTYVRTQFSVRSGQTIAIGGLVSEKNSDQESKVPLLGNIPWLGRLFRYNETVNNRSETIIFLTVKVLAGKDVTTPMGVPIRSRMMQGEIEQIEEEDAAGAVYDPARVEEIIRKLEAAEAESKTAVGKKLKSRLNSLMGREEPVEVIEEEESQFGVEIIVPGMPEKDAQTEVETL